MKILILSLSFIFLAPNLFAVSEVNVCGDGSEWPPYFYYVREGKTKTKKLDGFTPALLKRIFSKNEINIKFDLPPWSRCLREVEKNGAYQIATDSSFSEERNKKYLMSNSFYEISPRFFYLESSFPNGLPDISSVEKFLKLGNICGLQGYNYVGFYNGLKNENIDMGAKTYKNVITKTLKNRCIGFLARYEVVKGFEKLGDDLLKGKGIKSIDLPGTKKEKFYMLISRKYPDHKNLKAVIDEGVERLKKSGELTKILQTYIK